MMHSSQATRLLLSRELADWEERLVLLRVVLVLMLLLFVAGVGFYIDHANQEEPVYVVPGAIVAGKAEPGR
ncbi:hypothetical protein JYT83_00250 [bacterium AH-315-F18]|nr:hypothetical protein [bacterium AH-315-F18]